jgi:tRNA(adenine34) deaminase
LRLYIDFTWQNFRIGGDQQDVIKGKCAGRDFFEEDIFFSHAQRYIDFFEIVVDLVRSHCYDFAKLNGMDKAKRQIALDLECMSKALDQARLAMQEGEVPVGVVITAADRIIARAGNQVEKLNDVTAHAEMLAITSATDHLGSKYLDECTMYVTLEPCVMCAGAIAWSQLGRLVIAAPDEKRGFLRVGKSLLHPKTLLKMEVRADEAQQLMKEFFASKR